MSFPAGPEWTAGPDGTLDFLNQRWRDCTASACGTPAAWEWHTAVHPDELAEVVNSWRKTLESG